MTSLAYVESWVDSGVPRTRLAGGEANDPGGYHRSVAFSAQYQGAPVPRVVIDVMLKPEILDPQGQAVHGALSRLGFTGVSAVRQGKRFELDLDAPVDEATLTRVRELAGTLLANTVIEDFTVRWDEPVESATFDSGVTSTGTGR